jgi:hypothetical protein
VTSELQGRAARKPIGAAAILAPSAGPFGDAVTLANIGAGADQQNQNVNEKEESQAGLDANEDPDPRRKCGVVRFDNVSVFVKRRLHVWIRDSVQRFIDSNKHDEEDGEDLEGGPVRVAAILRNNTSESIEFHAGHNLAQSQRWKPNGEAQHRVAATKLAAVTAAITPMTCGNAVPLACFKSAGGGLADHLTNELLALRHSFRRL